MRIGPRGLAAAALTLVAAIAAFGSTAAQQRDRTMRFVAEYPLLGDDGEHVSNHAVKLARPIERLAGVVTVGNPHGKITLAEFYDLNCPYCRIASVDIGDLVDTDSDLKLVLVPYPVLGPASIAASRVELALAKLATPAQFYAFHRKIYAQRGVTDGMRALAVAHTLGFDEAKLTVLGNSDAITQIMKDHLALGNALGLAATPAFVTNGVAILGYPGRQSLQAIVEAEGVCGKVRC